MWTSGNVRTDLVDFLGPKMTPITWMVILKCSRETTLETIACHNGRSSFQPGHTIEESAGHCSRKLWQRRKLFTSADTNNVQRHG